MSARSRRDLENRELESLAQCLPLAAAITFQLDKASIVRLTSAYLALRNVFPPQNNNKQIETIAIGSFLLQTLDGFVLILDATGKMMYVSETASVHLGLSQVELIGSSIFDFLHRDDEPELRYILSSTDFNSINQITSNNTNNNNQSFNDEIERMFFIRLKCVLPKRNAGIIYNGYKTISCWGYSKICRDGERITNMGLLAVGYMLTRSGITELKLSSSTFMFRARLDLNIIFVDSRVTALTGFGASSLLDTSLYQMVLLEDVHTIEKAHKILLHKNQSTTGYYRLLHRIRGYVWAQSQFCIVPMLRATVTHCIVAVTEILSKREGDMTLAIIQLDAEEDVPGSTLGEYSNLFYKCAPVSAPLYLDYNAHILPDK
ncbi:Sim1b long isoform [Loa loa]|uniref:Sim1b long isoform n=2 Tax=Loa loa TaxID=7209 RepID=A0A1I7W2C9_LOALO|nr:Sim1b long isoform [Loa loa]EJD74135.1 Sim1b long isoform [Loa loa]